MIWRAAPNLRDKALWTMDGGPWDYETSRPEGLESKAKFRKWQNDPETNGIHFTLVEGFDPSSRIEEDNPARRMYGWVADYDADIEASEFLRRVKKVEVTLRPVWFSRTFSGGIRAVWIFEEPVWADCPAVAEKFLRNFAVRVKASTLAPNLDQASFKVHMLWEHGTDWQEVPESGEVPMSVTQVAFRDAVVQTKKVDGIYTEMPMDEVRAEIEKRYPGRLYGAKIEIGERVPLFWLPITGDHKEKDRSAIVAEWGVYAYSSRAEQGRVFWDELLGDEFVRKFKEKRLDAAITGRYFDGKGYWNLDHKGDWQGNTREDTLLHLRVEKGLSGTKKPKESASEVESALYAIQTMHRVSATAPFVFTDEQFVEWNGETYLNINRRRPMNPAGEGYGNPDNFPWLWEFFQNFFERHKDDKIHPRDFYLAEMQRAYRSFHSSRPTQGHILFVCGPAGKGKSLLHTFIYRQIFGSATDAGAFLVDGKGFNRALGESAIWYVDDNKSAGNLSSHKAFSETIKKHAATPEILVEPKYHDARLIPWYGRILVSCNDDPDSVSIIPDLDINILDKLCLFRVNPEWHATFYENIEMQEILLNELPYFLRWLLDEFEVPEEIVSGEPRYGLLPYHNAGLVAVARESSSHFRLAQVLDLFREQQVREKAKRYWEGTSTKLLVQLSSQDSDVATLVRGFTTIQFGRMMNQLHNQNLPWLARQEKGKQSHWRIDTIAK